MSKPTRTRGRGQLSRAEIKAYEARRAAAQRPPASATTDVSSTSRGSAKASARPGRTTRPLSHAEEFQIIKEDMKRLLIILGVLVVVLVAVTIVLR